MVKDPLMRVVKKMYKGSGAKKINNMHRPEGAGNFDNMDDYNIVDSIDANTGKIQHTPANAKDIVNKEYVDTEILTCWLKTLAQTGLTGDKSGSFNLTTTGVVGIGSGGFPSTAQFQVITNDKSIALDFINTKTTTEAGSNSIAGVTGIAQTIVTHDITGIISGGIFNTDVFAFSGSPTINEVRAIETVAAINIFSGTLTKGSGLYVRNPSDMGASTGTYNGIFLEKITGATNNWQIFSVGGNNHFGDGTHDFVGTVEVDGDLLFTGAGKGLPYGFVEGDHINWTQANAAQNTWYNISDADIVTRFLNNTTHDDNGKITILKPGMYYVFFNVAYEVNAANVHMELGIEVDGSGGATATGPHAHTTSKFANQEQESASGALMNLALNSTIETAIRTTDAGTPNFKVDNVHLTCYQIGG